jgi:phosphoribosylformylglycinamidine synthase
MSGSFEDIDVPPTLVSFAVTVDKISNIVSPEFKAAAHNVVIISPEIDKNGLPCAKSLIENFNKVSALVRQGVVKAAYTPTYGGIAEAVMKMSFGNDIGFKFADGISLQSIFDYSYGSIILELDCEVPCGFTLLGQTLSEPVIQFASDKVSLSELYAKYESKLESVFPTNAKETKTEIPSLDYVAHSHSAAIIKTAKPNVLIPVFPGTNCEFDSAKAFKRAGANTEIFVIKNLTSAGIKESVEKFAEKINNSQIIFIPGGFSGGDEPDGSGKFITAFFRNAEIKDAVHKLLKERDGLMCGICNGFQALIKLGLVPYGEIIDADENCPTLTFNSIGRHQSRLVRTRIASNKSPWLSQTNVGDVYTVPISHGEGRFLADDDTILKLASNGQIATQYVDFDGKPTYDIDFNPNNSCFAVEGITSPDGRVIGKMGHSERIGKGLYKNVYGEFDMKMFESAVKYFK